MHTIIITKSGHYCQTTLVCKLYKCTCTTCIYSPHFKHVCTCIYYLQILFQFFYHKHLFIYYNVPCTYLCTPTCIFTLTICDKCPLYFSFPSLPLSHFIFIPSHNHSFSPTTVGKFWCI